MPTNIEIKTRVDSIERLLPLVASLADGKPEHVPGMTQPPATD